MSRRKQSNPRQFKRALENGLDGEQDQESSLSGPQDELASGELSGEGSPAHSSSSSSGDPENLSVKDREVTGSHAGEDGEKDSEEQDAQARSSPTGSQKWDGPRELEVVVEGAERRVCCTQALPLGTTWGPFPGQMERTTPGSDAVPVVLSGGPRWLMDVNWQPAEDSKNNCIVYSKGAQLWCTTTKPLVEGEVLQACPLDASLQPLSPGGGGGGGPASALTPAQASALTPAGEGMYPARLLDSIQLLPQQAAMAAILPNAIVNKDIFPCKACGIWFRSERNLQAHLMYYCSGRLREADTTTTTTTMLGLTSAEQHRTSSKSTGSHVGPRPCPFPQCTMSFTGTHALEMHLLTHNSARAEDSMSGGVGGLKCTICSHTADTLTSLQQHILSHLAQVGARCEHCNFCFQTPAELARHQDMHGHGGPVKVPRDGDAAHRLLSSSSSSSSTVSPQAGHKPENPFRKESRQSPGRSKGTGGGGGGGVGVESVGGMEREQSTMTESHAGSHQASFSYTRVKSEPSSPRQASSPVQPNITPAFPSMGPFMGPPPPHVPFPQDLAGAPQASEILAKMSELVHRRLRHGGGGNGTGVNGGGGGNTGGGGYPPMVYSNLVPKGATCFECNISFSNLDNYLVHKKHYCNSRWQQQMAKQQQQQHHEYSSLLDQVAAAAAAAAAAAGAGTDAAGSPRNGSSLVGMLSSAGHPPELKAPHHHHQQQQHQHQVLEPGRLPSSVFDPFQVGVVGGGGVGKLPDDLSPQGKKASTPTTTSIAPEEIRQNGIQGSDMKSPVSPVKSELHPGISSTTCDACNITFSRHETYMVHKQYYCATRHDPPMKRANAMKGPGGAQKAVRARKRRKAYEINAAGADQDHHHHMMPPHMAMPPPPFLGIPALGNPCLTPQQAMETFRDQFHMRYSLYHPSMVPKHPEASLTVAKSALVSKCNAVVSSSREDLDAPIDLSKKCLPPPPPPPPPPTQFNKLSQQSPTSLMDYHECSVCKISFNKVQDYLAHKQNFCPGASVDSKLLLDIKKEGGNHQSAVSPSRSLEVTYNNNKAGSPEIAAPQNARVQAAKGVSHQNAADGNEIAPTATKEDSKDTSLVSTGGYPGTVKKMRPDEQIWPYYEIKAADYPSGMLMMPSDQREPHRKSPNEGSEGEPKDQPAPAPTPVPGRDQTQSPTKNNNDNKTLDMNGYHKSEEEKPSEDSEKRNGSPSREEPSTTSEPESPVRPGDTAAASPPPLAPSKTEEVALPVTPGAKRGANGSISSGNVKYCRPCDIQFNNLSNFITHKKFYCSSHTAEHVK
ncbi:zinc finger protein ZFPM2b [Engraulis encrasicolus]|uniref:zinc finger protein ZFPM2b n=1 Tax=Engraulis encrasicolus TaxID=184585 RepID=UPI002FD0E6C3